MKKKILMFCKKSLISKVGGGQFNTLSPPYQKVGGDMSPMSPPPRDAPDCDDK